MVFGLRSFVFAAALVAATPAVAADVVHFAPHRAVYDITLTKSASGSGVAGMTGRMVYELTGSACEGYTQNMRFVTRMSSQDSFGAKSTLTVGEQSFDYYRLDAITGEGLDVATLPFSLKVLLENLLRTEDGADITADDIDDWYAMLLPAAPTRRAHAYSLLSTIMRSDSTGRRPLIQDSPCKVEHPTVLHRTFEPKPATPQQIATIVENMPDKYQALILLSAWCGLRWGEVSELRRKDLDLASMSVRVERAVVWRKGQPTVGTPKSRAGVRTIALPPNLRPALKRHLAEHAMPGPDGLLFPNATRTGHLHVNTLSKSYHKARRVAGRSDLRIHDLRHSAATMAAQAGATLAELMARMGHSTAKAALVYQHVAEGRDRIIADCQLNQTRAHQANIGSSLPA